MLKSHAPIVMDELCLAQLDGLSNYTGTLCPGRSPFEQLSVYSERNPNIDPGPQSTPGTAVEDEEPKQSRATSFSYEGKQVG